MTDSSVLLDVNVLLALTNRQHLHHSRAHQWFATVTDWATTPVTESAFVRLMLNPVVAGQPLTRHDVTTALRALCSRPGHRFLADDSRLTAPVIDHAGLVGHQQVTDFHLVDLAARHGLLLATLDSRIRDVLVPADRQHVLVV